MGKVSLSVPQSEARYSQAASTAVVAGFGSGKTFTALDKAFDLLLTYPGIPVGYGAPTYGLIDDIWYPQIKTHCEEHGFRYKVHGKKQTVTIWDYDGRELGDIICRSFSKPDKIVGFQVGDFLLDELDIVPTDHALAAWRKCKARCRVKFPKKRRRLEGGGWTKKNRKKNQMYVYTTPEGYKATHQLFKKDPLKDSKLIQMSTYSNIKNLPKGYIPELMANYPPELISAYIMGIFTNLTSGTVYTAFDRDHNNAPGVMVKSQEVLHIGMDFNIRNMSAVVHVIRGGFVIAVDEFYKVYDTPQMILAIKERYRKHEIIIYPDASSDYARSTVNASLSDLKLIRAAGLRVKVNPSNPRIKDRLNSMNAMFCNAIGLRRYLVNTIMCPEYTNCLEQQAYGPHGLPDKTHDLDHLPDGAGYFINTEFGITKPSSQVEKLNS